MHEPEFRGTPRSVPLAHGSRPPLTQITPSGCWSGETPKKQKQNYYCPTWKKLWAKNTEFQKSFLSFSTFKNLFTWYLDRTHKAITAKIAAAGW